LKRGLAIPIIRYANCWEDASVLLRALQMGKWKKYVSIASGGDNTFSLLLLEPELVVGFDLNPVQLHLCELKTIAIKHLEYESCVAFLGFSASQNRWETYQKIREYLSEEARNYFDEQGKSIKKGIIKCGKFERYFEKFRKYLMPWIHSKRSIRKLLTFKSAEMQENYYNHGWNTRSWKWLFRLFYSRTIMGLFGRSPRFHKYVEFNVGDFIYQRAEKHLRSTLCQENEYLHFIFKGFFSPRLPVYMRKENFANIKNRLHVLQWFLGDLSAVLDKTGAVDGCNLSDIFEYMSEEETAVHARNIADHLNPGGRVVYWNLMVERNLANFKGELGKLENLEQELAETDKGFFYKGIKLNEKQHV